MCWFMLMYSRDNPAFLVLMARKETEELMDFLVSQVSKDSSATMLILLLKFRFLCCKHLFLFFYRPKRNFR